MDRTNREDEWAMSIGGGSISTYRRPTSNGIQEEKVEHKDAIELLSKFSTKELIEALELREDVQVVDTDEDVYKVSMDLFIVKKHVLLINNCNKELVERQRELSDTKTKF